MIIGIYRKGCNYVLRKYVVKSYVCLFMTHNDIMI
jgi:hypothetical protein